MEQSTSDSVDAVPQPSTQPEESAPVPGPELDKLDPAAAQPQSPSSAAVAHPKLSSPSASSAPNDPQPTAQQQTSPPQPVSDPDTELPDAPTKSEPTETETVIDAAAAVAVNATHSPPAQPDEPSKASPVEAESKTAVTTTSTPVSATAAKSSETSEVAAVDEDTIMTDPVVYGTRSRGRTAGARPNYAEDQDMDFEYSSAAKNDPKRNGIANESKRGSGASDSKFAIVNETVEKDSAPAASAASTNGTISRKRKAASSASTPGAQHIATASSNPPSLRRAAGAAAHQVSRRLETNMAFFHDTKARLNKNGQLVADDGTVYSVDDHVYLVCEPPGEPYYICRIMEFVRSSSDDPNSPVVSLRVNWFYRPRDVQRHSNDTRLVYGTMHSDLCPLTSLRGKCQIHHRAEIDDLDQYRKNPDHFWFNQIIDRFIRRFYEVVPTSQVINVPEKVKKALDERWKYICVEASRVKELTSAVKLCKRCSQFCASNDSVDCAMCGNSYHMDCVRPPLPKKPSRGFAWACGPCSRAQEKKLEARHTPQVGGFEDEHEEEIVEEEEEEPNVNDSTRAPSPDGDDQQPPTEAEIALAKMWPMRYLGIHCRVEDVLEYDDPAIYPRASSRLGPRHQATTSEWPGRPFELVKPTEIKKRYVKAAGHKKDTKLSKDTLAAMEADRAEKANRPKYIVDEPPGYVARGEDFDNDDPRNTAQLLFKMPEEDEKHTEAENDKFVDDFAAKAVGMAKSLRVSEWGSNLIDKALSLLIDHNYDAEAALKQLAKADRGEDLKEPILTHDDLKKFEDGVRKYGSEHRLIKQHMKGSDLPLASVIRFYYLWKKAPRGEEIWGNFEGRKSSQKKRAANPTANDPHLELGDDADDSAYDSRKAITHKKEFQCKFCSRRHSPQWRRAPGVAPIEKNSKDKTPKPLMALCIRCAGLWRKYAIQWEEQDEVARKVAQGGGKAWKRRIDEELLRELQIESNMGSREASETEGMTPEASEPAKKKARTADATAGKKSALVKQPTPPPPPIVPDQPTFRPLPCFVCKTGSEPSQPAPISCTSCKLTVHKHCYGLTDQSIGNKWVCDQCSNDRAPLVSTDYVCTLCPVESTTWELWETPKMSTKKKTDRDREKERLEKDLLDKAKTEYIKRQNDLNRPAQPREPLKKTDGNNWVHLLCAIWTPEIKFSNAKRCERAEGFSMIPTTKYEAVCKICKSNKHGACVSCQHCHASVHVACAFDAEYIFGFDVTPVKSSRKDQVTTVTVGAETGHMSAAVWCRDHTIKTIVHPMDEIVDDKGTTALQLFVENYKQADQTLTGTARKANLLSQSVRSQGQAVNGPNVGANRRVSTVGTATAAAVKKARGSIAGVTADEADNSGPTTPGDTSSGEQPDKKCVKCGVETSPKWWPAPVTSSPRQSTINGILDNPVAPNGVPPSKPPTMTDPNAVECHKCHHKVVVTHKRVPLSPKPFVVNLEWPPCLSEARDVQARNPGWPDQPHFGRPGEGPPGYPRPNEWQPYGQPMQYPPPHMGGHLQRPPLPPPPSHPMSGPPANGGYPYGNPEVPPHGPPHQSSSNFFDRPPPPRTGPPPPAIPPPYGAPPPQHGPPPPHHMSPRQMPPHHSPHHGPHQGSPIPGPPQFAPRQSGSPFHHSTPLVKQGGTPVLPPRSSPVSLSAGVPPPPGMSGQPSTPKPLEQRPGASNSPHIGNLLS